MLVREVFGGREIRGKIFWGRFLTWVLGGVGLKEWLMWVGRDEEDHESMVYFICVFSGFFFFSLGLHWILTGL